MVSGGMILDLYMVARCPPSQLNCLGQKLHMALCKNRIHTITFLAKNSANEKAKNVENDISINFFTFKVDYYVFCYECLLDNSKLVMNIYLFKFRDSICFREESITLQTQKLQVSNDVSGNILLKIDCSTRIIAYLQRPLKKIIKLLH